MKKGENIEFLGYTIHMSKNNDGIVLISKTHGHCGNFGTDVLLAKKYAFIHYCLGKDELRETIARKLADGTGTYLSYDHIKSRS